MPRSVIMSELKESDRRLIAELRRDGRATLTSLSHRLGIPRVTLHDRIERLKREGVIRRFTVVVDPVREGRATAAFVLVSFERSGRATQRTVAETAGHLAGVEEAHIIAGQWDLLLKVRGPSLEAIGALVVDRLREIPGVAATMTLPCFVTVKESL